MKKGIVFGMVAVLLVCGLMSCMSLLDGILGLGSSTTSDAARREEERERQQAFREYVDAEERRLSAQEQHPQPPEKVEVTYNEIPISDLKQSIQDAQPGQGFIVNAYLDYPSGWLQFFDKRDHNTDDCVYQIHSNDWIFGDEIRNQTKDLNLSDMINSTRECIVYFANPGNQYKIVLEKIDGLMTQSEIENFYVYSGLVFGTPMYAIGNWDKAFADKQSAQTWFDDIVERAITVNALIEARDELYQQNVRVFKRIPSITTRDTVLRDKNNLIEAYNRYKPINADIEEVFVKGVTLEKGKAFGRSYQYPGLRSDAVTRKINAYENEYATLIDTYPVN